MVGEHTVWSSKPITLNVMYHKKLSWLAFKPIELSLFGF